ncbi:hypothetical protein DUY81_15660 [Acidipropionibacterium acidipropionici]|nr:hypothetical protein DUY81_15660 [Acidipropionibacterium acidipropionici]
MGGRANTGFCDG